MASGPPLAPALAIRCGQRAAPSGGGPAHMPSMEGQSAWRVKARAGLRGVGRAGGPPRGPGSVGSRGWSRPRCAVGRRRGSLGQSAAGSGPRCTGLVELPVPGAIEPHPDRLTTGGGIGAAPPSMAKAASLGQRPGGDQAHSTVAATIGPTPQGVSSSGRHARTRTVMARVGAATSASRAGGGGPGRAGWPRLGWSRCPRRSPAGASRRC